jgi:HEPN domain-containing protein
MNRAELQELSRTRIREAKVLYDSGEYSGAYYLAGYAVECALKACIAKSTQQYDFPDKDRAQKSYSHKPQDLIKVAELYDDLEQDMRSNQLLATSWTIVTEWSEQSRYEFRSPAEAAALLVSVSRSTSGVLPWIEARW